MHRLAELIGELHDEQTLLFVELCRDLDHHLDHLIAPAPNDSFWDPLATNAQDRARLSARRNTQHAFPIEGRDLDFVTENGLGKRHRKLTDHIVPNPPKQFVRPHLDRDLHIARFSAAAYVPSTGDRPGGARLDTRRQRDIEVAFFRLHSDANATLTRKLHGATLAVAHGAGPLDSDRKNPLLITDAATPVTGAAHDKVRILDRPPALAGNAIDQAIVVHLLGTAESRLVEINFQVELEIASIAELDTERIEQVAKNAIDFDFGEIDRHAPEGTRSTATRGSEARRTKAIVHRAFLGIAEDLIRGVQFFEALARTRIVGIAVRVVLRTLTPKRALDFRLRRVTGHAEYFVRVLHRAAC